MKEGIQIFKWGMIGISPIILYGGIYLFFGSSIFWWSLFVSFIIFMIFLIGGTIKYGIVDDTKKESNG
jgi:hypothetical protein